MLKSKRLVHVSTKVKNSLRDSDRNWLEFLAVIDAAFLSGSNPSDEERTKCTNAVKKAEELFINIANEDGVRDRSGLLALLELEKRARHYGVSSGAWLASFEVSYDLINTKTLVGYFT